MENFAGWWTTFQQSLGASLGNLAAYAPALATAVAVMLVGWIAAVIVRALFVRAGNIMSGIIERFGRVAGGRRLRHSGRILALLGNVVFWVVLLLFAAAAARVAGLEAFSGWLDELVGYLPTFIAGVLIAIAGLLFSSLARDIVVTTLESMGSPDNELAGLTAQSAVLVTAIVIGLDQIGIDVTFLIILIAIVLGGALLSVALAFGLGARHFVSNIIAARQAHDTLQPGDIAVIANVEGRVLEITATGIVLLNDAGRHFVPASWLQRDSSVVKSDDEQ